VVNSVTVFFNLWFVNYSPSLRIFSMESLNWRQLIHWVPSLITSKEFHTLMCAVIYFSLNKPWRWKHYVTPIFFHPLFTDDIKSCLLDGSICAWLWQNFIGWKFVLRHYRILWRVRCSINAAVLCYMLLTAMWRRRVGSETFGVPYIKSGGAICLICHVRIREKINARKWKTYGTLMYVRKSRRGIWE
jgi:hypothetical protein